MNYDQLVEKLARNMALANSVDPSSYVTRSQPWYITFEYRVVEKSDSLGVLPAWHAFVMSAKAALETLRGMTIPDDLSLIKDDVDLQQKAPETIDETQQVIKDAEDAEQDRLVHLNNMTNWRDRQGL